jgi:putative hydroxymethylpyrimidine transport system substrate-binding protein
LRAPSPARPARSLARTIAGHGRPADARPARRIVRALALLPACLCLLALAACGSKQDTLSAPATKPFTVMLDFFPNADHAALYSAIANGDFRAAGLDVKPETPSDPSTPLKLLAAGRVDMAISYEPELLLARDQGLQLVSIGALVQRPLTSIIALPSAHVRGVADLAGKRVGTAGIGYQTAELHTALQAAGVSPSSVREANVGFNLVPAMLSGKVAATLGGFWNYEALQLEQMGRKPVVIPIDRAGVPTYDELVLVVREDEAGTRGQDLRAFMQALTLGAQQARGNPRAAATLITKANPSAEEKLQLASLQATLPATLPSSRAKPYGWQDPSAWAAFSHWMFSHKLIQSDPNRAGLPPFTNEFLPGQGI